jgi:uncharacterized protein DUF6893
MNKAAVAALALVAGIGVLAKSQAPEIQRYLKVKKM